MESLVQPQELAELMASAGDLVLVDVSYLLGQPGWGRQQYEQGHVAGAHFVDVETELSAPRPDGLGGRHPLPPVDALEAVLRRCGIGCRSLVVAIDQGGMLPAARLWWLLRWMGHDAVTVLDGGMAAWRAAGLPVTTEVPEPGQGDFLAGEGDRPVVGADELLDEIARGHRLVDVRTAERFRGEVEPIDRVAGHIPGATNLPIAQVMATSTSFKPRAELQSLLAGLEKNDMVSCGSGLTAGLLLLACEVAGIDGLRLYPGSWSDWISTGSRPVATGPALT